MDYVGKVEGCAPDIYLEQDAVGLIPATPIGMGVYNDLMKIFTVRGIYNL